MFLVLYHLYFIPNYMIDLALHEKKIIYKNSLETNFILTFDDSPTPDTNKILDCLKKYNVKALFFVITERIQGNEAVLDRMLQEGHKIGNHGSKDTIHVFIKSEEFERDLIKSDYELEPWLKQERYKYFRPGFGFFNETMLKSLDKHNYTMVLGNVYPYDAFITSAKVNAWYIKNKINKGSIVVLHDRPWTAATLEHLLPSLTSRFQLKNSTKSCAECSIAVPAGAEGTASTWKS